MAKRTKRSNKTMTITRFASDKAANKYAEKQLKTVVTDGIHAMRPIPAGPPEGVTILTGVKRPAVIVVRQPKSRGRRITPRTPRIR